jgi:HAE1 family hydrophobic/amphiphilic exporter-1
VGRRAAGVGPTELSRALAELMRGFPMPRGYEWSEESTFLETREQMAELMDALYLGVILVFLLMGILFESIILPLSILFIIPFAVFGAVWSLHLFVGELDPMAIIGLILLAGIVVNNGIVLLDCIVRLRRQLPRPQAILEGTRRRLRAIVMTATTTVVGLLPMAVFGESTGSGLNYVGMSVVVAGGLATCTVFTAFIVPLCYTFLDDLSEWLRAVGRRARHTAAPALAPALPAPAATVAVPPRPQQPGQAT